MSFEILNVDQLIQRLKGRKYKYSQVHHTWQPNHSNFNGSNYIALQQGMKNYHVNTRGWNDIGQHVTLFPDGLFVTGRPFDKTPAGISGYNTGAFMVEMLGDFDLGRDKLEGAQLDAMLKLQHFLVTECGAQIMFHREHASKSCPGTGIDKGWFIQQVATYGQSKPTPQPQTAPTVNPAKQPPKEDNKRGLIKSIQSTVNSRYGLSITVDGFYGPETRKALLKGFQKEIKVSADGIWGPKTAAAAAKNTVRMNAKGNHVWILQALLYCHGYDPKGLDSIFGSGTADALLRFQRDRGLTQDAIAGKNTFEKLFA